MSRGYQIINGICPRTREEDVNYTSSRGRSLINPSYLQSRDEGSPSFFFLSYSSLFLSFFLKRKFHENNSRWYQRRWYSQCECVGSTRSCLENIDGSYQPANADKELNVYLKACRLHTLYVSFGTHASMPLRAEKWISGRCIVHGTGCSVFVFLVCDPKRRYAQAGPVACHRAGRTQKEQTSKLHRLSSALTRTGLALASWRHYFTQDGSPVRV